MNINLNLIDQRVRKLAEQYETDLKQQLKINKTLEKDKHFFISTAFVLLCIQTVLEISLESALDCLTEGGNDAGIDGLHIGDLQNNEFVVTLFQGKYKANRDGTANFPENAVIKILNTIGALFDPDKSLTFNLQLRQKIEEIRSLIRDGYIPTVRVMLCNNGLPWNEITQQYIDNTIFGDQVNCTHINHDKLIELLQKPKPINDSLQLIGKGIVEEFNYRRVFVGKIAVTEIKKLFTKHGNKLLERNIRHYLGLHKSWVNQNIQQSLIDEEKRQNFYFYNNGITMICSKFRHNALQNQNYSIAINDLQIINGGQTCLAIKNTLDDLSCELSLDDLSREIELSFQNTYVLLRLYELDETDENLVHDITYATNSQNPVDLRDLKANDAIQRKLVLGIKDFEYEYERKRDDVEPDAPYDISSQTAAEAIFAIWRCKPHQLKVNRGDIFGHPFYVEIFNDELNAAQLIIAVLILRMVKMKSKTTNMVNPPSFLPYADYFLAMLIGKMLLEKLDISLEKLDHQNFAQAKNILDHSIHNFYSQAINKLKEALIKLYGDQTIALQQLSATFRRGDLLEFL
ncbi:AIPR family protein [Candidatus Parabeggiatoa sp. HSG14]|uniref:AIPR family protein n=1 Tax=Candidatus Parabeggiatoa sp. HSG14 TaxID=3055593 RepID=UPI0025A8EE2B|nr:AIPR family protein [Thiotrichales bacterium HSG14]